MDFWTQRRSTSDDLNNVSDKFQHEMNALVKRDLELSRSYDRTKQTASQLLSTEILEWFLKNTVEGQKYMSISTSNKRAD